MNPEIRAIFDPAPDMDDDRSRRNRPRARPLRARRLARSTDRRSANLSRSATARGGRRIFFWRARATIAQYSAGITIEEHPAGEDDAFVRRMSEAQPFVMQRESGCSAFAFTRPGAPTSIVELHVEARVVDQRDLVTVDLPLQLYRTVLRGIAVYEELEQRRAESSRVNQEKADLLAMLAHDVRTPLTTIIGYTELIAEENDVEVTTIGLRAIAIAARAITEIVR